MPASLIFRITVCCSALQNTLRSTHSNCEPHADDGLLSISDSGQPVGTDRDNEGDPDAWRAFVDRYGKRIYEWCLNRRLQAADAEDVTQNVLVKLSKQLGTFEYQAALTFRGWLRRITENAITDFFRERQAMKRAAVQNADVEHLNEMEAKKDLADRLCAEFDIELLELAKQNVKARVDENRWRAWEMTAVEDVAGSEVAAQLNMKLPSVYSSRHQVQKMIAEEVRQLMESSEELFRVG